MLKFGKLSVPVLVDPLENILIQGDDEKRRELCVSRRIPTGERHFKGIGPVQKSFEGPMWIQETLCSGSEEGM